MNLESTFSSFCDFILKDWFGNNLMLSTNKNHSDSIWNC